MFRGRNGRLDARQAKRKVTQFIGSLENGTKLTIDRMRVVPDLGTPPMNIKGSLREYLLSLELSK